MEQLWIGVVLLVVGVMAESPGCPEEGTCFGPYENSGFPVWGQNSIGVKPTCEFKADLNDPCYTEVEGWAGCRTCQGDFNMKIRWVQDEWATYAEDLRIVRVKYGLTLIEGDLSISASAFTGPGPGFSDIYESIPERMDQLMINMVRLETVVGNIVVENNNELDGYQMSTFFPSLVNVTGDLIFRNSGHEDFCQLKVTFQNDKIDDTAVLYIGGDLIIDSKCNSIASIVFGRKLVIGGDVIITATGDGQIGPEDGDFAIWMKKGITFLQSSGGITIREEHVRPTKPEMRIAFGTVTPFDTLCTTCMQNYIKVNVEFGVEVTTHFGSGFMSAVLDQCKGHANLWFDSKALSNATPQLPRCRATPKPTAAPSTSPTPVPTTSPSLSPTVSPSTSPTNSTASPTPTPTNSPMRRVYVPVISDENKSTGVSTTVIIVIVVVIVAVLIAGIVAFIYWRRRSDAARKDAELVGENFMVNPTFATTSSSSTTTQPNATLKSASTTTMRMPGTLAIGNASSTLNNMSVKSPTPLYSTPSKSPSSPSSSAKTDALNHYMVPTSSERKKKPKAKAKAKKDKGAATPKTATTPPLRLPKSHAIKATPRSQGVQLTPKPLVVKKGFNSGFTPTPSKDVVTSSENVLGDDYLDLEVENDDDYGVYDGSTMPSFKMEMDDEDEHFGF